MTKRERLRRIVFVSSTFARNLAFYHAGWEGKRFRRNTEFWRAVNSNFLDVCILEWCKLFGDHRAQHHWSKRVSDPAAFEKALHRQLNTTTKEFEEYRVSVRLYRDKFVAHLDSDKVMHIPWLGKAQSSVWFYHAHVVKNEAQPGDLAGLPLNLGTHYRACADEARAYMTLTMRGLTTRSTGPAGTGLLLGGGRWRRAG
jgi:hypothetical protein